MSDQDTPPAGPPTWIMPSFPEVDERGVPILFRRYREWTSGPRHHRIADRAVPGERVVVEPLHERLV
jgi:hypothetical protein